MLAFVVSVSLMAQPPQQHGATPSTKELIAFFSELKRKELEQQSGGSPQVSDPFETKMAELQKSLASIKDPSPSESPQKVAGRWLNLLESSFGKQGNMVIDPSQVLTNLPPPEAWPTIRAGLHKTYGPRTSALSAALVMYGELLDGTNSSRVEAFNKLKSRIKGPEETGYLSPIESKFRIANAVAPKPPTLKGLMYNATKGHYPVTITQAHWRLAGASANVFFKDLFTKAKQLIVVGDLTEPQQRQLAQWFKETAPQHAIAQWGMVNKLDTLNLFPTIVKRFDPFPKKGKQASYANYSGVGARSNYIFGLASRGEVAKAVAGAGDGSSLKLDADSDLVNTLSVAAKQNILQLLAAVAKKSPTSPAWEGLEQWSLQLNKQEMFEAAARQALALPKLNAKQRAVLQMRHGMGLLAIDKVEDGIKLLRAASSVETDYSYRVARTLTTLAYALQRPELAPKDGNRFYGDRSMNEVYELAKKGKLDAVKQKLDQEYGASYMGDMVLAMFLQDAIKANDADTVLTLIEDYTWTTKPFGSELSEDYGYSGGGDSANLADIIAKAMLKAGRIKEAGMIARKRLYANRTDDDAYIALINAEGDAAIPLLDSLAAADPYQERPLIWKAKRLLMSGKVDEAESTILAAIKIDPSDGETGRDHRMVVYSVYADILDAKGKADDAHLYRNAVAAIRLSERADAFLEIGMLRHAIALYQDSLELFSNAYCIQSRLAHHLASIGRKVEALEHYRRAYELMSSSFGYVETHCFGCEHVFEGEDQQKLAESVFLEQLKASPNVPQNHYLLGYLREEQGRTAEAITHFREALRLAPNYANAAVHLLEMDGRATSEERQAWTSLSKKIKSGYNSWEVTDDTEYRVIYNQIRQEIASLGIEGSPSEIIKFKVEPNPSRMSFEYAERSDRSHPAQVVAGKRALSACSSLIQQLMAAAKRQVGGPLTEVMLTK